MGSDLYEMGDDVPREMDDGYKNVDARIDRNLEPYVGMEFDSDEAARKFYNDYSKCVGFSIRTHSAYRSKKDSAYICRTFVCSKEGHRRSRDSHPCSEQVRNLRPSIREGCKAMLSVKKQESGLWVISKFEKDHNHPLTSPDQVFLLRSHRRLSGPERQMIDTYRAGGIGPKYMMNAFRQRIGGVGNVGFTEKDCRSYVGKGRLNAYGIDAQHVLDYFKCMQAINPAFFYAIEVDQDDCLSNVFWVDARSRNAYIKFGDVVTFDMTCKKNQFQMPFAPFIGVNHHQQSVLFGSALLSDETESTFVWLFQTWLEAMSGRHPKAIITDQDKSMNAAITKVFPETRHHYCLLNILKKVPEKLSHVYHEHKDFNRVFHNCVNNSETINEFELGWASMLDEYNLKDNDWFQSLYDERERWVPLYLRGTFFAGMSTGQSESVNSLFKGYLTPSTTFNEFVKQYELALEKRYEKEVIEDFNTYYTKPFLRTPLPMEEQAVGIYTRNIFKKFQEQLIQSLLFAVNNSEETIDTYQVSKFDESKAYTVTFNSSEMKASCPCMLWEFEGILCKHVLAVFRAKNIFTLPSHYILDRWTKDAKRRDVCDTEAQDNNQEQMTLRFNSLWQETLKFAEEGASSVRVYKEAMGILREAMEKLTVAKQKIEINISVHPDPGALFYETQCGSQYGPITVQYEYGQYNSEDTTEATSE